jgi:hypothetical protein
LNLRPRDPQAPQRCKSPGRNGFLCDPRTLRRRPRVRRQASALTRVGAEVKVSATQTARRRKRNAPARRYAESFACPAGTGSGSAWSDTLLQPPGWSFTPRVIHKREISGYRRIRRRTNVSGKTATEEHPEQVRHARDLLAKAENPIARLPGCSASVVPPSARTSRSYATVGPLIAAAAASALPAAEMHTARATGLIG